MDYNELIAQVESLIAQAEKATGKQCCHHPHNVAVDLTERGLITVAPAVGYTFVLDINSLAFRHSLVEAMTARSGQ